jgi:O-antigen ligase/polysaccharide polymerase Wzy-like membrane protein
MAATRPLTANYGAAELLLALGVTAAATFGPPATSLSLGLTGLLALLVARLDLPRALALAWGLAIVPVYLDFQTAGLLAQLVIAPILFIRIFVIEERPLSLPGAFEWLLAGIVLIAGIASAAVSDEPLLAAYYLVRLVLFLLYLPAARAVYTSRRTIAPSLTVFTLALVLQATIGLVQFLGGIDFAMDLLNSPVAPAFIIRASLEAKLLAQDFNWIAYGFALPSGLFLNSIVFAVCLATGGMLLVTVPAGWFPNGRPAAWRAGGLLALLVSFGAFKLTAWLGILAGAFVFILTRLPDRKTRVRAVVIPPVVLLVVGFLFWDAIQERLLDIARGSLFTRLLTWFTYAENLQHHGLIGVGLGRAGILAPSVATAAAGQQAVADLAPESTPIGLSVEIGIPGMLALYGLVLVPLFRKGSARPLWAWPAIATLMVGSLAVYGLTDDHAMPLLMLMVGLASSHGARET